MATATDVLAMPAEAVPALRSIITAEDGTTALSSSDRSAFADTVVTAIGQLRRSTRDLPLLALRRAIDRAPTAPSAICRMARAALSFPRHFPEGLPSAIPQHGARVAHLSLTHPAAAAVLGLQFFCAFPPQGSKPGEDMFSFLGWHAAGDCSPAAQYLLCLFDFFLREEETAEARIIEYGIYELADPLPVFGADACNPSRLCGVRIQPATGRIGDTLDSSGGSGAGECELVFAAANFGFGPSGTQEEIMCGLSPELCLAPLLLRSRVPVPTNAVAYVRGALRFGECEGYGRSVTYTGPLHHPAQPAERAQQRLVVFMDALPVDEVIMTDYNPKRHPPMDVHLVVEQSRKRYVVRELTKARAAFTCASEVGSCREVGTGKWGCGAYGGDPAIKTVIQLLAASWSAVDLNFYAFGDEEFEAGLASFLAHLKPEERDDASGLWRRLRAFRKAAKTRPNKSEATDLFTFEL